MLVKCDSWRSFPSDEAHCLLNADIAEMKPSFGQDTFGDLAKVGLLSAERDTVVIEGAVDGLSLHGGYLVQVRLTKKEIARLVRLAWNDEPVSTLLDALSEQPNASLGALDPDLRNVNRPIDELGLSQTVCERLSDSNCDIQTIGELALKTEFEIRRLFGRESLEEIKDVLAAWKTPERPTDLHEFDGASINGTEE